MNRHRGEMIVKITVNVFQSVEMVCGAKLECCKHVRINIQCRVDKMCSCDCPIGNCAPCGGVDLKFNKSIFVSLIGSDCNRETRYGTFPALTRLWVFR